MQMSASKLSFSLLTKALFAGVALFLAVPANAVDPERDYWSIILPVTVPKAGVGQPPGNAAAGLIKIAYETTFENYWKDISYFDFDPVTGVKRNGYFTDTMTRGYYHQPWPINSRVGAVNSFAKFETPYFGPPRGIGEPVREFLDNGDPATLFLPKDLRNPLVDTNVWGETVWTPGESFRDDNNNGQWSPPILPDDRWEADNPIRIPTNICGELIASGWANHQTASGDWDSLKGELFADYNRSSDLANGVVGYDPMVNIYIANTSGGTNRLLTINELDLTPTFNCLDSNEGDFNHTWVPGDGVANPSNDVPQNAILDYTVNTFFQPYVYLATNSFTGNRLTVTYRSYVRAIDGSPYLDPTPVSPTNTTVVLSNIVVNVYQTGELFGDFLATDFDSGVPRANIYGEFPPGGGRDGVWTPGFGGEYFEDFISWWDPFGGPTGDGGMTYVFDMVSTNPLAVTTGPNSHPGHDTAISRAEYEEYIRWNYIGDADALILRAGNGVFDGPDSWVDRGANKHRESGSAQVGGSTLVTSVSRWETMHHGSFNSWWSLAFGTSAPSLNGAPIPNVPAYTGGGANQVGGWIPLTTLDYDGPREFVDMASSMYHLGGDPNNALGPDAGGTIDPRIGMWGGDGRLGEVTSPNVDLIYGEDLGADIPSLPLGPNGVIPIAGPWAYNIDGNHGYDAGNVLNLELATRRYRPADGSPTPPGLPFYRDGNLDGIIDQGESRAGEANYNACDWSGVCSTLGGGMGPYPYNRDRFIEDALESLDHPQDFKDFKRSDLNPAIAGLYAYTIYPTGGNEGWGALGGPAGAVFNVLTRDRVAPFQGFFQARPFSGSGIGNNTNNVIGTYAMAILAHEMGHDVFSLPDLYDYDVWNGGANSQLNWPIGAYDLMSNGSMVHMIPDMKLAASGAGPNNWTDAVLLEALLSSDGTCSGSHGPVVVEMYPVEDFKDNYFYFGPLANVNSPNGASGPNEYFTVWFQNGQSQYSQSGTPGVMIGHTDLGIWDEDGLPSQQRVNGHFTWRIIQADGFQQLDDGVNLGDGGDLFPGTTGQYVFSADTIPAARWYSEQDSGLRILDIQLPAQAGQPALVTMEWTCVDQPWVVPQVGADSDDDGLIDAWEFHYYGDLAVANGASDLDTDGLTDYVEWQAQLSPLDPHSNDPVNRLVSDADIDMEPDGLSNIEEQFWGTHPLDPDSDDDNFPDGQEVNSLQLSGGRRVTDPLFSLSPAIPRSLCLTGTPVEVADPLLVNGTNRFELTQFTVEAWVKVDGLQTGSLVKRTTVNGQTNFDLRLVGNVPRFSFTNSAGTEHVALGPTPISVGSWVHLAGVFDSARRSLELFVNGVNVSATTVFAVPATGASSTVGSLRVSGFTTLGDGLVGSIDEVRIWDRPRTAAELLANHDRIIDTPWVNGPALGLVANYRFDDSFNSDPAEANGFEDFIHPLDWSYAVTNTTCVSLSTPALKGNGLNDAAWDDQNGDGLPDWWQALYFDDFDPVVACVTNAGPRWCPDQDPDVDTLTNLQEWELDTNPLNPQNNIALPPTVTGIVVTVSQPDGLYTRCQILDVLILFPSNVTVVGTPILRLSANPATAFATYAGQVASNTLSFTYKVGPGEVSADLDYASQFALERNGGIIAWAATLTEIDYTLALPGAVGSISEAKQIQVDGNVEDIVNGLPRCSSTLVAGPITDCPLSGSLDSLNAGWTTGATTPGGPSSDADKIWRCTTDRVRSGSSSMMAGGLNPTSEKLKDNETAWVQTQVLGPGEICFNWVYSVEPHITFDLSDPADYARFLIDGVLQVQRTGENFTWESQCFTIPAGVHTLRWEYKKDDKLSWHSDAVWVDDVQFNHVGADTDGDGLADAYENLLGTLPNNPDSDGDGVTDYNEVRFGLNPLVAETEAVSGINGSGCIEWAALTGEKFLVQRTGSLAPANWLPAPEGAAANEKSTRIATANGTLEYCDPDPLPGTNFYRVIRVP